MKFIAVVFALCIVAAISADEIAFSQQGLEILDPDCAIFGPNDVTKTDVIYHSGTTGDQAADIKFGDLLNDKIAEIQAGQQPNSPAVESSGEFPKGVTGRREILLKCKVPGCTFNLAASQSINTHFKIRGEVKQGVRPNILLSSPFVIGNNPGNDLSNGIGDFVMESVNIIASGKQSQSHIRVVGATTSQTRSGCGIKCVVLFDKVDFKNHQVGFSNGGALQLTDPSNQDRCVVDIINSRFVNNSAKSGGAIHITNGSNSSVERRVRIANTHFVSNAAIEQGGAIWISGTDSSVSASSLSLLSLAGVHFKDNTADKKGDTFLGRGGAIYAINAGIRIRDSRTHGGNTAKFGNLIHLDNAVVDIKRFGCYEGPYSHVMNSNGYEGYGDYYTAYPVCSADSYDTYALREDIYARAYSHVIVSAIDLPGGVTCEEDSAASVVERHGCGSHIYAYHCEYGSSDNYVEAEDYDRDGFDCRYDCNDVWRTVNPAAGEQCNVTVPLYGVRDYKMENHAVYSESHAALDSNCNGLANEWVDMDGDRVPDWYDQCPYDYWKIAPGKCGCGLEDTDGCVQNYGSGECTTVQDNGVWYYMCEGQWWYWANDDWSYGGTY